MLTGFSFLDHLKKVLWIFRKWEFFPKCTKYLPLSRNQRSSSRRIVFATLSVSSIQSKCCVFHPSHGGPWRHTKLSPQPQADSFSHILQCCSTSNVKSLTFSVWNEGIINSYRLSSSDQWGSNLRQILYFLIQNSN